MFFDPEVEQIQLQCAVMRNFYNYLLHHDVCPEYEDEIFAARKVVDDAKTQLVAIHHLSRLVPGDFNVSCSVLLDGNLAGSHGVCQPSSEIDLDEIEENDKWDAVEQKLLTPEMARVIVSTALCSSLPSVGMGDAVIDR